MPDARPGRNRPSPCCPRCGRPLSWTGQASRPFCSMTCELVALGAWLDERPRVAGPPRPAAPLDPELVEG